MKKSIIAFAFVFLMADYGTSNSLDKELMTYTGEMVFKFEKIDKLVRADWANVGSWISLYDPLIENAEKSAVLVVLFHREHEDMGRGGKKSYIADKFIRLVNLKFNNKTKLIGFENDGRKLALAYEDGIWIIWDYASKKEPTEIKRGSSVNR